MRRPHLTLASLACLLGLLGSHAHTAQAGEIGGETDSPSSPHSATRAVAGGLLGGTLGFTAGFLMGAAMVGSTGNDYDEIEYGFIVGSVVGGIGLPLGVHAGNKGRGNGWLVMGTSIAAAAAGLGLTALTGNAAMLPITAVGQLVACTAVEMATMPDRDPAPRVTVGPASIDGKFGLVIAGRF